MLCALIITAFPSSPPTLTVVPSVCRIGFEISIDLSAFLSMILLALRGKVLVPLLVPPVVGFFKNEAIRFKVVPPFFPSSETIDSGVESGLCCTEGASGAALIGTLTLRSGEINSFAVHVEFSKMGDEMIGLAVLPGFGGGKAGPVALLLTPTRACLNDWALDTDLFKKLELDLPTRGLLNAGVAGGTMIGGGGAGRDGSVSTFLKGASENPLNWPKNSCWRGVVGLSFWRREWLSSVRLAESGANGGPRDLDGDLILKGARKRSDLSDGLSTGWTTLITKAKAEEDVKKQK
jgi:hypothetical protein